MSWLQQWGFLFFVWTDKGLEPYSWLCTCVLCLIYICICNKRLYAKQHWLLLQNEENWEAELEDALSLFFFPLFFFYFPSPFFLQEVTLNRELFSRLQPEFYNKISVPSPYFFTCKVVAVIIWQLPSWLTCSRLNWGSPELKVWAATLWAKAL